MVKLLNILLIAIPLAIAAEFLHWGGGLVFLFSAIAIVPLAATLGNATEQVSFYTGEKIGGMLNATMGNVPELLIGFFGVKAGLFSFVMASMIGSVIGNTLLVLGASALVGGLVAKRAVCNAMIPRFNFTLLIFAFFGMLFPAVIKGVHPDIAPAAINFISIAVCIVFIAIYCCNLYFTMVTHKFVFEEGGDQKFRGIDYSLSSALNKLAEEEEAEGPKWKLSTSIIILAIATFFVAWMSELLVGTVEIVVTQYGVPEAFIGIIIVPILGNVAEHAAAMLMAYKSKMNIAVEIAVGSGTQVAMFVAPVLVLISFALGTPMPFIFNPLELVSLGFGVFMGAYMLIDGGTNWLEGVMQIAAYLLVAIGFYFF